MTSLGSPPGGLERRNPLSLCDILCELSRYHGGGGNGGEDELIPEPDPIALLDHGGNDCVLGDGVRDDGHCGLDSEPSEGKISQRRLVDDVLILGVSGKRKASETVADSLGGVLVVCDGGHTHGSGQSGEEGTGSIEKFDGVSFISCFCSVNWLCFCDHLSTQSPST